MAGCVSCGGDAVIEQGAGIKVTGSGTASNPYVIESTLDFASLLQVRDTDSINFTLLGSGTPGDPFVIRGVAGLGLADLDDVEDPSGGPAVGETLVYVADSSGGHWEFRTPPPAPAGAVNTASGVRGDGTAASPLSAATSGVWGQGSLAGLGNDSTVGLAIYVDSENNLRARPVAASQATTVTWANLPDKPTTFPPAPHSHNAADISANQQLFMNVGRINGKRITTTTTSSSAPTGAAVGDIWMFPRGS